jgi:hypothetical protein
MSPFSSGGRWAEADRSSYMRGWMYLERVKRVVLMKWGSRK